MTGGQLFVTILMIPTYKSQNSLLITAAHLYKYLYILTYLNCTKFKVPIIGTCSFILDILYKYKYLI